MAHIPVLRYAVRPVTESGAVCTVWDTMRDTGIWGDHVETPGIAAGIARRLNRAYNHFRADRAADKEERVKR